MPHQEKHSIRLQTPLSRDSPLPMQRGSGHVTVAELSALEMVIAHFTEVYTVL